MNNQKNNSDDRKKLSSLLGRPTREMRARAFVIFTFCTFFAAVIIGRLVYLQIVKHEDYQKLVLEQMIYETPITASRGGIIDRNGVVLATNYTTERIFIESMKAHLSEYIKKEGLELGIVTAEVNPPCVTR